MVSKVGLISFYLLESPKNSVLSRPRDSGVWIDETETIDASLPQGSQVEATAPPNPLCGPVSSQQEAQAVVGPGPVASPSPTPSPSPASSPEPETIPGAVAALTSMGFSRPDAEEALRQTNNDVSRATSLLVRS